MKKKNVQKGKCTNNTLYYFNRSCNEEQIVERNNSLNVCFVRDDIDFSCFFFHLIFYHSTAIFCTL